MLNIKKLRFNDEAVSKFRKNNYGEKCPIVYIINNNKEAYIGETTDAYMRTNQHFANSVSCNLKKINLITDEKFNKSTVLNIEYSLIKYMSGDGLYQLQNANNGVKFNNYYKMKKYNIY